MAGSASPPPSPLYQALNDPTRKQAWVNWVFNRVANRYDLGNDVMSLGWHTRWKRRLVAWTDIAPHHRVLDMACGTGDTTYMVAAKAHQGQVIGTDVNPQMMALANPKRPPGCTHVHFVQADSAALPFADASFDRVTCTYAGRGFTNWRAVATEVYRVLVPGGVFTNLDFGRPPRASIDTVYRMWLKGSGAVLGALLHGNPQCYTYIPASLAQYPGQHWLRDLLQDVGFESHVLQSRLGIMGFNKGIKH